MALIHLAFSENSPETRCRPRSPELHSDLVSRGPSRGGAIRKGYAGDPVTAAAWRSEGGEAARERSWGSPAPACLCALGQVTSLSHCFSIHSSLHPSLHPSTHPVHPFLHPSICLSIHPSTHPCPSIPPSIYASTCLSAHPHTSSVDARDEAPRQSAGQEKPRPGRS